MARALLVNLYYPPHHLGGYEASCRDVAVRLAQRGHQVAVLTSTLRRPGTVDPPGERSAPVPVWRDLTAYLVEDGVLWSPSLAERWRIERSNQAALRRALDAHQPDVVAVWQLGALSLGLVSTLAGEGVPLVYAVCDDWLSYAPELDAWHRAVRRVPRPLRRIVGAAARVPVEVPDLGRTGPLLFVSELTRERARRYAPWTLEDTAVVHSGVDTATFTASPSRGPRPWTGRLLYAGRFDPRKGIETAVRAMALLPDAFLEVRGTGGEAERARIAALIAELGIGDRVEIGTSDRAELAERYRAADAVLFPTEWEEPFGLVPLEAMACGTPVVASGPPGAVPFLLDGCNCLRFEPGDPAGMAAAVQRAAEDPSLRERLVANGLRTAAFFDVERLVDTFEAWHAAAASRFAEGRPAERVFAADALGLADG